MPDPRGIPNQRPSKKPGLGRHGGSYHKAQKRDSGGGKKPPKDGGSSFVADNPKIAYALVAYFALIVASPFLLIGGVAWVVF
jgi:hypothetical protein